jgi:hypothetical protein
MDSSLASTGSNAALRDSVPLLALLSKLKLSDNPSVAVGYEENRSGTLVVFDMVGSSCAEWGEPT